MSKSFWLIYQPKAELTAFRAFHWEAEGDELTLVNDDKYLATSLDALRERFMDMGLVRMARDDADDPMLIETWL